MSSASDAEPRSLAELRRVVEAGFRPSFLFFWGHTARGASLGGECLSQWYPAAFHCEGRTYATAEHFMMAQKALLFGDHSTLEEILEADSPGEAKRLGRRVRGFDERVWRTRRSEIVLAGSYAKFSQNAPLRAFLLSTRPRVLVEASPRDAIWGIGLAAHDPRAQDPLSWQGANLLGFALMQARARLVEEDQRG
ncbi:MAG: NADAR family protein [Polyangiaceae bacterium]